jgi:rhamnulokinase
MGARNVVAIDLGAESGRVVLGRFDGTRVALEEVHRFPTPPRPSDGHLRWDLARIWSQITTGLAAAGAAAGTVDAVGVDAWGVDYGLLGRDGELLGDPVSYRDSRTAGMLAEAAGRVGRERLYLATGIQLLELNTIFQLMAEARAGTLQRADRLLLIPDLFHRLLSGAAVAEYTVASTTGAYDMAGGRWATDLLDELGVPTHVLPEVVDAGTDLGPVRPELPGYAAARVIAPPSHDTASAVVGVPLTDPDAAYISSGTWSLVGVETREPVINEAAMAANLTNEGGAYGTIRLLRNSTGMWLLQESRRQWAREGHEHSYEELVRLAASAPAGVSVFNADHPEFVAPGDVPARIRAYCSRTGQPVPQDTPALVRSMLDSLALAYRSTVEDLTEVTGRPATAVHIVGGGSRNHLLNQAVADVTGLPVVAGPVEATALGNVCVQLIALGDLAGLPEAREVVRASAGPEIRRSEPSPADQLAKLYGPYRDLVAADRPPETRTVPAGRRKEGP